MNRDVQILFSRSARTYDFLNHFFSFRTDRGWRRKLIRAACIKPDDLILDSCTGTADLAIGIAALLAGGKVLGIDYSEPMLELGREKVKKAGMEGKVELRAADAVRLPFPDNTFDIATVAFGLRNLYDRVKGIGEMVRVLKPGGKLLILEFSPPPHNLFGRLYGWYLGRFMPAVGGRISGSVETYRYLDSSIRAFLKPEEVKYLLERAGLEDVTVEKLTLGIAYVHRARKPAAGDKL